MRNFRATFLVTRTQMSALAALRATYAPATYTAYQLRTNRIMLALAQIRLGPVPHVPST